jgi:uncharacterized RDD family membrane protein YckC
MTIGEAEPQRVSGDPEPVPGEAAVPEDGGWIVAPPSPWRRYGARMLDVMVSGAGGFFLLAYVWYSVEPFSADRFFALMDGPSGPLVDFVLTVLMAGFINAVLLGLTGYTVGKAIFGIKVVNPDGSLLGIGPALLREMHVWVRGLAFGIPMVSLIPMVIGYNDLVKQGSSAWDRGRHVVFYRPAGPTQTMLNLAGVIVIILSRVLLRYLEQL